VAATLNVGVQGQHSRLFMGRSHAMTIRAGWQLCGLQPRCSPVRHRRWRCADDRQGRVVLPYTGPLAAIGSQIERGVGLYVKQHERDLEGITLEIIRRDDQGRPDVAAAAARQLIEADRSTLLSAERRCDCRGHRAGTFESKLPFIALYAASNELTRKFPNVIRMSIAASQTSNAIGAWSAKQGAKTGYVLVTESSYGSDAEAAFTRGFAEGGGKLIGAERIGFSLDSADFVAPLLKIKSIHPDIVLRSFYRARNPSASQAL